mmetsp:Transcript_38422/g.83592  ORF Transcript_38422/g.83592 Transcript_38422/m.83592 type:complete len:220 (+) Transcript_38422:159-818(+)
MDSSNCCLRHDASLPSLLCCERARLREGPTMSSPLTLEVRYRLCCVDQKGTGTGDRVAPQACNLSGSTVCGYTSWQDAAGSNRQGGVSARALVAVRSQAADHLLQLFPRVQVELRGKRGDVHVGGRNLLLHHCFQGRQRQRLCLLKSHLLAVVLLQRSLRTLRARADCLCLISHERAGGVGVIQVWPSFIPACHQEGNAERTTRDVVVSLAEAKCQIAQ